MSEGGLTDPLIGTTLAGYRVESLVGHGGMSAVYLAEDLRLGRPVALKLLPTQRADDERFRERFQRESRLAASLDHPNVVPIFEAGDAAGQLYIAMRFVEGIDLGELLEREGRLDPERVLALLEQVGSALDAAHARGLVHRDVKPSNILIGEGDHAYLSDFGLTKRSAGDESLTETGGFLGTIHYVAPEQIEGDDVREGADVYSLGCVLYECLTGTRPFPRDSDLAVLWAHVQDEPPAVTRQRPDLPAAIDAVVAMALAKDPTRRFARCGDLLAAAGQALAEGVPPIVFAAGPTRKTVTVLFADLAASSATATPLDPESLGRAHARCLTEMTEVLERHGAAVDKLPGHGLLGVFGLPVVHEDDALRAMRAAAELRDRVEHVSRELEDAAAVRVACRVAVDTGEVVAPADAGPGDLGGEPLNLAARLEEIAGPGEILLGEGTQTLVADRVVVERLEHGPRDGQPPSWRLVALLPEPPALSRAFAAGIVGRARELDELQKAFAQAVETRTCRLVTVLGPAGIGKSRLAHALAASVEDRATVLAGRCLSYGEGITYWPIGEIVRAVAAGGDPVAALRRLLTSEDEGAAAADLVAAAVGLSDASGSGEETFWAVRRLFATLARARPLVVVLEDVHWAEPTLLDCVEHVARATRDAPVLVVCLARPDLFDAHSRFGAVPGSATLELGPLTKAECSLLVEQLRLGAGLAPELAADVVEVAEGNPLFLEQLLAMASEDAPATRKLTLPPAIQALLAARLDRLPAAELHVIECASIEGLVFHVGPLAQLCRGVDETAIWRHLLALTRKELVRPDRSDVPGDEALRFGHALIREAAYQGIAKERRAELHEEYGGFLERTHEHAPTALELEEIVGYHLEQAVQYRREAGAVRESDRALAERASGRLAAAGRRALGRLDLPAAINLLERAAALPPAEGPERALVEIDLGAGLAEAGRLEDADALLTSVEERLAADRRVTANARVQRFFVRCSIDLESAFADLRRDGDDLLEVLAAEGDERGLARLWLLRGLERWTNGQVAHAEEAWERGAAHAAAAGDRPSQADILGWLASAAYFGPVHVTAGIERCTEIAEELRDLRSIRAQVLHFLAGLHAMAGRFEVADALLADANAALNELSVTVQWAVSHTEVLVAVQKGDLEHAESLLRLGCARLEEIGERNLLPVSVGLLARVLQGLDRPDEALACAERTRTLAAEQDIIVQVLWRGVRARVLASRGAVEEAERLAREATDLAGRTDFATFAGEAHLDLAYVLQQAGKHVAACQAALEALRRFENKGNDVAAASTRALVDATAAT